MIRVYVDGAQCRLDRWRGAGWGLVAVRDGVVVHERSGALPGMDVADAEWTAIVRAVEFLGTHGGIVVSDSSSHVDRAAREFAAAGVEFVWERRCSTEHATRADTLARRASRPPTARPLPQEILCEAIVPTGGARGAPDPEDAEEPASGPRP